MSIYDKYVSSETEQEQERPADVTVNVSGDPSVMGTIGDIAKGIVGGTFDAVNNTLSAPVDIAETVGLVSTETAEAARKKTAFLPEISKQETTLGEITRTVTRFGLGFAGAGKFVSAAKGASMAARVGANLLRGAVGDFVVSDPHETRLADLVQSVPSLDNPVTEFLATDPTDGRAEGRFKAALEGVMLGGITDVVLEGVKGIRAARALRKAGDEAGAARVLDESTTKVNDALQKASTQEHQLEMFPEVVAEQKLIKNAEALAGVRKKIDEFEDGVADTKVTSDWARGKLVSWSPENHDAFRERLKSVNPDALDDFTLSHGVLNYNKMDSKHVVKQTLDDFAALVSDDLKHVGGTYRSQETTKSLAHMIGGKPEVLMGNLRQIAKHADMLDAYVVSGKMWAQSLARDIYDMATKIDHGLGGQALELELARRADIMADLVEHLSATQTGAARATAAGRIRTKDAINPGDVAGLLEKLDMKAVAKRIRMAEGDPRGVIASLQPPSLAQKAMAVHNFYWMNSILSGFKTTVVNNVSNAVQTFILPAERILGGMLTMQPQQIKEGLYQYAALHHTIFDAFSMAKRAWSTDAAILDRGNTQIDAFASMYGKLGKDSAKYLGIESSPLAHGVDFLGKVVGMPGRFLNAQDEFWKQVNYRSHVMASAWSEAYAKGMPTNQIDSFVRMRLNSAIGSAGEALDDAALRAAQEATFTQSMKRDTWLGTRSFGEIAANASASHPLLRGTVLPFVKVPTNLMRTFMDLGPQAVLQRQFYTDLNAGGEQAAMAMGKLGLGTAFWSGAAMLAHYGRITGAGPQDKDLQRQLRSNGWQPYSIVFNNDDGTKTYVSYARMDPLAYFLGLAADYAQVAGKIGYDDMEKFAVNSTLAMVQNLSNKTYLRGMVDVMGMLGGGYNKDEAVRKYFEYKIASYVPSAVSLVNPDDELKQLRGWMDGAMARVPGLSQSIEAKRDNFGKKFIAPMGYPNSAINPFTVTTTAGDRVREELSRLALTHAEAKFALPPEKLDGVIDLTTVKNSKGQTAYDRWLELHGEYKAGGKTLYESLDQLMKSDTYKRATESMGDGSNLYRGALAVDLVKANMEMYRQLTLNALMKEFPEVRKAQIDYRVNAGKVRVNGPGAATPNPLIAR